MADPLSVGTGVAGLLSLTLAVAKTSYQYVSSFKGASAAVSSYLRELSALKIVLLKLDELLDHLGSTDVHSVQKHSILAMDIEGCRRELEELHRKLQKRSAGGTIATNFNRLTWPFAESETQRLVEVLHRYQSIFHMAISTDAL